MPTTNFIAPTAVTSVTGIGESDTLANLSNLIGAGVVTIAWGTGAKSSQRIYLQTFNFAGEGIASGDTLNGFEFKIDRQENSSSDNLAWMEIYLINAAGTLVTGTNYKDLTEWPTGALATMTVGSSTNLNGLGYTGADALDADFGISIRVFTSTDGGATAGTGTTPDGSFDNPLMALHYTVGGGGGGPSVAQLSGFMPFFNAA